MEENSKLKMKNEYLLETDIFLEHLTHRENDNSFLEIVLQKGICFTTSNSASELFFLSENEKEASVVKDLLSVINVLGYHSRYSLVVPKFRNLVSTVRDAMVCAVAYYNKLPIVCIDKKKFINSGLPVLTISELE